MQKANVTVLDCTLRDGGYYNDWDFTPALVANYLNAVGKAGVDVIELGLRMPPRDEFLGPFAYTTDKFLKTLNLPDHSAVAVMINAKDYTQLGPNLETNVKKYFTPKSESPVQWVRIAIHFEELGQTKTIAATLKQLGYKVGLNLMQAGTKTDAEIEAAGKEVASWDLVDVLYFADSLGNMNSGDVERVIVQLRKNWRGDLGIHTHNNMGFALPNTMHAIDKSTTWVDATILGMGRGAGNAKMEHLLIELAKIYPKKYHPASLFPIVLDDFKQLQRQYEWGENLPYYLAAAHKIHPTYIQEVLGNPNFKTHHVISALSALTEEDSKSYSASRLQKAVSPRSSDLEGSWSPKALVGAENVLILANGPKLPLYRTALIDMIKNNKLFVLSLNINNTLSPEFIDAYVACNQMRFYLEASRYKELNKPVIMPLKAAPDVAKQQIGNIEVWDYGMETKANTFEAHNKKCVLNNALALPYALSICEVAGAKNIFLAGFDGVDNKAQENEVEQIFEHFSTKFNLRAITPTTYHIKKGSVFAPMEL